MGTTLSTSCSTFTYSSSRGGSGANDHRDNNDEGGEDYLNNLLNNLDDDNERSVLSPHASVDISRELLDYSHLSESFVLGEAKRSFQPPRRLFDEDCGDDDDGEEDDCGRRRADDAPLSDSSFEATNDDVDVIARGKAASSSTKRRSPAAAAGSGAGAGGGGGAITPRCPPRPPHHPLPRFVRSVLCIATTPPITPGTSGPTVVTATTTTTTTPNRRASSSCPPASPNVSTFYGKWGSRRERRVSTLPSLERGRPVRLRVAALRSSCPSRGGGGGGGGMTGPATPEDDYYFSYDPHFSPAGSSEYSITMSSSGPGGGGGGGGRSYGNGLALRMGGYDGRRRGGPRRNDGGGGGGDSRRRRRRRPGAAASGGEGPAESGGFASASQFMILEDRAGSVPCVIKSLRTHDVMPSAVVYAPMARYEGQVPSGHRLTRRRNAVGGGENGEWGERRGGGGGRDSNHAAVVIDDDDGEDDAAGRSEALLYPWALIRKGGRTMEDECLVHLVKNDGGRKAKTMGGRRVSSSSTNANNNDNDNNNNNNNNNGGGSIFHPEPSFRGRHGFDERGLHTHTVVSRTTAPAMMTDGDAPTTTTSSSLHRGGGKKTNAKKGDDSADDGNPTSLEEVPCCLIVRDPSDLDAVDLTIAPGIDPLLMICYLASHSKMDEEEALRKGGAPEVGRR